MSVDHDPQHPLNALISVDSAWGVASNEISAKIVSDDYWETFDGNFQVRIFLELKDMRELVN